MQNASTLRLNPTLAGLIVLLSACSSDPITPAPALSDEQMLRESQGIANLGDKWKKGKQLVVRGNVLVREGQGKIDEGNRLIEEGEKMKRDSEESYRNIKN